MLGAYVDYGGHTIASTMTVEYNIAVPTFNESSDIISPGVMTLGGYCGMTLDNGTVDSKVKCIFQNDVYYASNWSMNNPSGGSTTLNGFYWENEVWVDNQGSYALRVRKRIQLLNLHVQRSKHAILHVNRNQCTQRRHLHHANWRFSKLLPRDVE